MTDTYTPARIAERLNISTTTLRRYEEQGLIPEVCAGYDIPTVYEVMRKIKAGRVTEALWLINHQLAQVEDEKQRLITSTRHPVSGYRIYSVTELRKILVISSLRKTVYYIENLRKLLQDVEMFRLPKLDRSFQVALEKLNEKLRIQYQGIAELMAYIRILSLT
ncbi:MerR family DNA-binding transcriptional regulator [Paenibacillus sp. 3LSP]|uniref:MerR family DNA-binding transcriptional regulator n=1 Tax=Paenibacillus sp. 3LSP TaxID=2800795 RepID=UPI0028FD160C|nr:MerR family DNA-binding transcriptional regulator [Paenibacillus sp. 3LSP]MDU0330398.1 MerR family DNA-binding transcriptional regulator [Paenibacillus sp. 3LSP]